jgi:hypothetical protein
MPKAYFLSIAVCAVVASFQSQNSAFTEILGVGYRIRNAELRGNRRPSLDFLSKCAHMDLSAFLEISPLFGEGVFRAFFSSHVYTAYFVVPVDQKGGSLVRENKRESSLSYIFSPHHSEFFPVSRTKYSPNMTILRHQEDPSSFQVTTRIPNVVGGSSSSFGAPMSISHLHRIVASSSSTATPPIPNMSCPTLPLKKFHLFPDLPSELRQKIFAYAIPIPPILRVQVTNSIADPELEIVSFNFRVLEPKNIYVGAFRKVIYFNALLSVCKEAKDTYKRICYAALPGRKRRLIRYNPDETIVYITNLITAFVKDDELASGIGEGWRTQQWFKEIKRIGVPNAYCLHYKNMTDIKVLGRILERFEALEEWTGLYYHCGSPLFSFPLEYRDWTEQDWIKCKNNEFDMLREQLEEYWSHCRKDYKPPRILAKVE